MAVSSNFSSNTPRELGVFDKPINPLLAEAWPPSSRRVYRFGVFLWVLAMQVPTLLVDLVFPHYWLLWHFIAGIAGLMIGHLTTMRILAIAIQEWKNRV